MVLTTGTVMAQAIGYLITPILTRIYSNEEMGDLGVYMRAVGFLSTLATARYELSLPLPKNDAHSFDLYRLSLRIAGYTLLGCSLIGAVLLFMTPFDLDNVLFFLITLFSSIFLAFTNIGTNWSIRNKDFRRISVSKISNSLVSNSLRWLFGIFHWGSLGLLFAGLIGYFVSSLSFVKEFMRSRYRFRDTRSKKRTQVLGRQYKQFPMVSLPHAMLDMGRDLLVAMLIVGFFSKEVFGSFNHSYMVLRLPLMFIGVSIGQVFFNRCSEMVNKGEDIYDLLRRTLLLLLGLSIVPFLLIMLFGEPIFEIVFGTNWGESGQYSQVMAAWLMLNFVHSPISNIPIILNRQKEYFLFGLISTAIQIIGFGVLPFFLGTGKDDFMQLLWIVSILMAMYHVLIILFSLKYAKIGLIRKS